MTRTEKMELNRTIAWNMKSELQKEKERESWKHERFGSRRTPKYGC